VVLQKISEAEATAIRIQALCRGEPGTSGGTSRKALPFFID
jgi:hypothetical protein